MADGRKFAVGFDLYAGRDLQELPAYPISEVAHFLRLPKSTLRSWILGQGYRTKRGPRRFEPIIRIADPDQRIMSFMDLVEADLLSALRRQHFVKLDVIRTAVKRILRTDPDSRHPLAASRFATDGVNLFIEELGKLVNLFYRRTARPSRMPRGASQEDRARRGRSGDSVVPVHRRDRTPDTPTGLMIDPRIAFGRPVITGTGIPTATIFERYFAGETPQELSEDYERPIEDIDKAIRWEHARAA